MEKPTKPFSDKLPEITPHYPTSGTCPWCKYSHAGKCSYNGAVPTITSPITFNFKKKYDAT